MSARPRDLLKSRALRIAEVLRNVALGTGGADTQIVLWGNDLAVGTTTTKFQVAKGEVVTAQGIVAGAAVTEIDLAAGAATAAGNFRKVLVERAVAGTIHQVVGVASTVDQASAVLPAGDPLRVSIGWIEVPASFVVGTTVVTAGMLKAMPYSA